MRQKREGPDDAEVGILFVHGMGDHRRGDFLRQVGEPFYEWVSAWLGAQDPNAADQPLRAHGSSFRVPHREDSDAPAHATLQTVIADPSGTRRRITWVAAEGWWANEISPPAFGQVANWGLGLAPWMIVRYFRRHWHGLLLLPSLALVILFQILILALTVLGAVPRLRNYVVGIQLRITGALGDVMLMVASPLQFSAMATRLASDLEWLRARVPTGRIAVIAHSQGTGVAHAALKQSRVPVDLFVTFGTALEKLHIAREVQRNQRRLALGSSLTIAGGILLAIAAGTWVRAEPFAGDPGNSYLASRVLLAAALVLLLARMGLWFHFGRVAGALLALVGLAALAAGVSLVSAARVEPDRPWSEAVREIAVGEWRETVRDDWHRAALIAFAAGAIMVIAREVAVFLMRKRNEVGGPSPRPSSTPFRNVPGLGALLDPSSAFGNVIAAGALIFGVFCIAMSPGFGRPAQDDAVVLLVTAGLACCFAAVPVPVSGVTEATAADLRLGNREPRLQWHNYWASADLVPDLDLPAGSPPYVHDHEVRNQASMLADHTTYHENREEFLAGVTVHLAALARWDVLGGDGAIVDRAVQRRRWRVRFLMLARWLSTVGMVVTWWILSTAGLRPLGDPLEAMLGNLIGAIPGIGTESVRRWLPAWLLGGLVVAAITSFWYRVMLFQAWRYWDHVEAQIMFRREPPGTRAGSLVFEHRFAVLLFALGSTLGLAAAVWSPNLLVIVAERLRLLERPESCADCGLSWILRPPGERAALPGADLWAWPWGSIGLVTLAITLVYAALILLTTRRAFR